ncbi:tyrosine-type recombinase/integrase [Pseudomonas sp. C5pp]|uniref:tyrosine-type recombinase/integrase n=1 Tax=Pseudomonas sp. C5pp TaxID=1586081 RepID=UPI000AC5B7D2|nr:tyrosine-type recombinase/integrase [Pseudomonas sp. C5pp]
MPNLKYVVRKDVWLGRNAFKCLSEASPGVWVKSRAFEVFIIWMIGLGFSFNTMKSYSYKGASFLDYLVVGLEVCGAVDRSNYIMLARLYHSYITQGLRSMSPLVQAIARRRPSPMVSNKTSGIHHAAVQQLIESCYEHCADAAAWPPDTDVSDEIQLIGSLKNVGQPRSEQEILVLEGMYGRKVKRSRNSKRMRVFSHLPKAKKNNDPYEEDKFFPLDKIGELIRSAPSYRDAALWSLIAATSLRASEALQLLWADIDFERREVYAVNPSDRSSMQDSYAGLSASQIDMLSWKGRVTKYTLLLEPYGEMFFENLEKYLKYEYRAHVDNDFVFQSQFGYPLFLCDYGSVIAEPFTRAAEGVLGFKTDRYRLKLHSLRHSYCFYMKNFVEHTDGIGLSDYEVMALTGHADVASVARYAIVSLQLLNEKLSVAFTAFKTDGNKGVDEMIIGFHEKRIAALRLKIAREQSGNKSQE